MTSPAVEAAVAQEEIAQALADLAELVCRGVPGCDGASISLVRDGAVSTVAATHDYVEVADSAQYERGVGPCLDAMAQDREVTVPDYSSDGRWPGVSGEIQQVGVRSSLSLPLARRGAVLGSLNLYAQSPEAFAHASSDAARAFARQSVMMLGYLQRLHAERAAHLQQREMSEALQQSLLPVLPDVPGITAAARYRVSSKHAQVGGDWYDLFPLPDGAVGVAIGDVMGHDLAAAAAMGQFRSVLRSYAYEGSSPSVVLDRLDRLVQGFEMAQLATTVYGRISLDPGGAMLLSANAGHPPPLLRTADGAVSKIWRGAAPLIGAVPPGQANRSEGAVLLPLGSLLVLYTDGLVETRNADIDDGIDALVSALAGVATDATPEQVCDELLAVTGDDGNDDDIALLVVRIDPTARDVADDERVRD